jgi:predicted negative regulator of RcsB-dependent stress response
MQWAHERVKDDVIKRLVVLRLARVKYGLQKFDEAEALLTAQDMGAYAPFANELLGDIYLAKNDVIKAKNHFRQALESMEPDSPVAAIVRIKLGDLGEGA